MRATGRSAAREEVLVAEDDGTSHSKHPTFFVEAGSVGSHKEQGELVVTAGRVISPGCNAGQYRD